jgi:hypothetical protein
MRFTSKQELIERIAKEHREFVAMIAVTMIGDLRRKKN